VGEARAIKKKLHSRVLKLPQAVKRETVERESERQKTKNPNLEQTFGGRGGLPNCHQKKGKSAKVTV